MTDVAEPPLVPGVEHELADDLNEATVSQTGASLFPGLVWAHFCWERERQRRSPAAHELEREYMAKLDRFQDEEGMLEEVYWSTRKASAVAMTVKREPRPRRRWRRSLRLREHDDVVHLHRVSDWVTREASTIAELLHECDLLSIRVSEVLRGTSERIAMRWILGVETHLLGFFERTVHLPDEKAERELAASQRKELAAIEQYYHRAASKSGRIVYVSGMLIGVALVAIVGAVAGVLLWAAGLWPPLDLLIVCYFAGAIGALVSVMSRMSRSESGRFNIDFELGRPLIRRLGVFRPFVGSVIGVALFAVLASGILPLDVTDAEKPYYYGLAAFLAGFSERFARVTLGTAERRLGAGSGQPAELAPSDEQTL